MKRIGLLIMMIWSLLNVQQTLAQQQYEEYTHGLNGSVSSIKIGDISAVSDLLLDAPSAKPTVLSTNVINNIVTVAFNEPFLLTKVDLPDTFSITLKTTVYVLQTPGGTEYSTTKDFVVCYSKNYPYKKSDIFYFNNGRRVRVQISDIQTTGISVAIAQTLLQLTNDMRIDRDYDINCSDCGLTTGFGTYATSLTDATDVLTVSWPANKAAEMYDLEWVYIDKAAYDDNRYGTPSTLAFAQNIFLRNSSRVTVTGLNYNIPLLFSGDGFVFFRYRAVQNLNSGERVSTKWSYEYNLSAGLGKTAFSGHANNLNWQMATTFAEEGKKKSVVQYFDGLLKDRQTVTKNSTTNTTIVAENLYDHQGRISINVLPSPTLNSIIKYTPLFTRDLNSPGSEYNKDLYDGVAGPTDYCSLAAPGMATTEGASKYYSPDNLQVNDGANKYIPDAKNYPFSETKYTQDNTGRIAAQGGVGPDFRLGSGNDTKYYYGAPTQAELDALFGTDAGDASHYQKNMVRDANGQYSVSYVDMKGRTVATALAGDTLKNLKHLDSYNHVQQTESLLTPTNNLVKGNSIIFTKSIVVTKDQNYKLTYSLDPQTLKLADKEGQLICYDCLYDLTITITDDCNNQNMPGGVPYVFKKSNFLLNEINSKCSDTGRKFQQELYPIRLKEGTYNITKELSLSQSGKQYYRDSIYMSNNLKKTAFEDIYAAQMTIVKQQLGSCEQTFTENDADFYKEAMFIQMKEGRYPFVFTRPLREGDLDKIDVVIKYHPEYQIYLRYAALQESSDWDKAMNAVTTYTEAVQKGYLNPLQSKNSNSPASKFFNPKMDPFFLTYSQYYARMTDSLMMAMPITVSPITYTNMWALSNMLAKCTIVNSQMDPACVAKFSDNNNVYSEFQLCPTELDDAWNKFKSLYFAKKQILISDYLFAAGTPRGVDETYRLFKDPRTMFNKDSLGIDPYGKIPATLSTQAAALLNTSINDNCTNYVKYWWSRLANSDCGFVAWRDSATLTKRLLDVCKEGGDQSHPYGASTVKPGSSNAYKSFNEAIVQYVKDSLHGNIQLCNGLIIDAPGPYDQPLISASKAITSKPDECECKNIRGLYKVYNDRYKVKYGSMSNFMKQVYKTDISNGTIDSLLQLCNNQLTCTRLPRPLVLPPVLQCGYVQNVCVNCEKVADAYNTFKSVYAIEPSKDDTLQKNIFFAGYMYDKTGVRKTATEYLNFVDSCNASSGNFAGSMDVVDGVNYVNCIKDSIVVPSTGQPRPSFISCADLIKTYKNFIAEFPNHSKGATVRMYVNDGKFTYSPSEVGMEQEGLVKNEVLPYQTQSAQNSVYSIEQSSQNFDASNIPFSIAANDHLSFSEGTNLQNEMVASPTYPALLVNENHFDQVKIVPTGTDDNSNINVINDNYAQIQVDTIPYDTVGKVKGNRLMTTLATDHGGYWVDTTLTSRQLFEWYMNEHFNTGGYTCENFADWLVNGCGYKLNQLPWSGEVFVRQDTLQNIWNRFIAKYPVNLLTISEAVNVPIKKGGVIGNAVETEEGIENVIYGFTWTNGNWIVQRSANTFDLAVLPANATISSANLSLYAYNALGATASHYRVAGQYPYMQLQQVKGLYIPNKTIVDFQPDTYAGTPSQNLAPLTSDNWSNQDYPNQSITTLVSSMYSTLRNTGINYPVRYKLNDETTGTYRLYQFGGIACPDPAKRPVLTVTYSAARQDVFAAFVNNALGTYLSIGEIRDMYSSKGKLLLNSNCTSVSATPGCVGDTIRSAAVKVYNSDLLLCGDRTEATFLPLPESSLPTACKDSSALAYSVTQEIYNYTKDTLLGNFDRSYNNKCLGAAAYESLVMVSEVSEYHYTLYYYDQAGNLVKTVPPGSVTPNRDPVFLAQVATKRSAGESLPAQYAMVTLYRYNSLDQVVSQFSPDGNQTNFWYDRLGRLAASSNAQQKLANLYSYTLYDVLGRIREVGQKQQPNAITDVISRDATALNAWVNYANLTYSRQQVTRTMYDDRNLLFNDSTLGFNQKSYTLRNRVAYTQFFNQLDYSGTENGFDKPNYLNYDYGSFYGYDIYGNVDTLFHDYRTGAMAANGYNRYKMITYQYDLVSGKVNLVSYQPGKLDEMYHRYNYDAENRITEVFSTNRKPFVGDGNVEEKEAKYSYYLHGPLARTEIGSNKVQGLDYTYTLQGWLKGVNSTALNSTFDIGNDGINATSLTAKDAFGFSLNYFKNDYKPINQTVTPFAEGWPLIGNEDYHYLFNGNISNMSVAISGLPTQLYNYKYDQINRLINMAAYTGLNNSSNQWSSFGAANGFGESITYDANGNIKTYSRDGNKAEALPMDRLTYEYIAGTNQLDSIRDNVAVAAYEEDIDNQPVKNYAYDAIGNLIKDSAEKILKINWTVYGKIQDITKTDGATIKYSYDVAGNRISKTTGGVTTWYVRDAQGNTLSTYEIAGASIQLKEQFLYGSSRLGVFNRNLSVSSLIISGTSVPSIGTVISEQQQRGQRQYELSNHLGNVLATITDKKKPYSANGSSLDYYLSDVLSAQDYYPFGMQMPGRKSSLGAYRYGFNGKENDNEVKGEGNQQDYGMRIYDPRVGRFLSVDPLTKSYPELTPYQFASNTPIESVDLDGLERSSAGKGPTGGVDGTAAAYYAKPVLEIQNDKTVIRYQSMPVLVSDFYGNGLIASRRDAPAIVEGQRQAYNEQVGENIRNGLGGSLGYIFGKDKGSFIGAGFDQMAIAIEGIPGKGYLSKPGFKINETDFSLPSSYGANEAAMDHAILRSMNPSVKKDGIRGVVSVMEGGGVFSNGMNGKNFPTEISPNLNTPSVSLEKWSVLNCAEPKALNTLLLQDIPRESISVGTFSIKQGTSYKLDNSFHISGRTVAPKAPCLNCAITTQGLKH